MGYTYAVSLVSVGILAVLMLALLTERERKQLLQQAIARIPGFRANRAVSTPGAVLAVDDAARILCIASVDNAVTRVDALRFDQVLECEILRNGQRVTRAVGRACAGPTRGARPSTPRVGDTIRTPVQSASSGDGERIMLRVVLDHSSAPVHVLHMRNMREAVRWHVVVKQIMEPAGAAAPRQPADNARSRAPATAASRPDAPRVSGTPAGGDQGPVEEDMERIVRESLSAVLAQELRESDRIVIPEHRLRDRCGVELPVIRFHDCMNRIRRNKALAHVAMTYSRRDETWRIRKKAS